MESESVLRWGYRAYTSDKPRPIHLTTQNTAGASVSLGTIPMVLPVMAQWALNDWPVYFSKIMSNSLPVGLPLQPMALHAVPQTQSDAHFWSCSLGLQYPFFRPSQLPSHLMPGCALMSPTLPWLFHSPTLVYFFHTSHHYSQLFIYIFTSLQSISSEYHISFIRAVLLSVWFLDVS